MTNETDDDRRIRALDDLAITESSLDPLVGQVCELASSILGVPMAFMSLVDATHQHLVAHVGIDGGYAAREDSICQFTIEADAPLVIENALADPRVMTNPFVIGGPLIRFYAGIPLCVTPGVPLGAFCIADTAARRLSPKDLMTLRRLADIVVGQIKHHASKRKLASQTVAFEWIATHDRLTTLLNRAAISTEIDAAIQAAETDDLPFALIMLDIDRFKMINDTLGQHAGDTVLLAVTDRLRAAVGSHGLVARTGGDEFAVLVTGFDHPCMVAALATDILMDLRLPVRFGDKDLDARSSLGIAFYSDKTRCASDLFKEADIALFNAREAGRDGFTFYDPSMSEVLEARMTSLAAARTAVVAHEIEPYYQPKICLKTNAIVGFEALLRWHHPTLGLCGPAAMGDVFSDTEIASAIGRLMLDRVAIDMVEWRRRQLDFGHVAINVAEPEFYADDYADRVFTCLASYDLAPALLEVEVTESVFLGQRSGIVARTLRKLDEAGISIALDDFGTGYASLTHLKQYPVGSIKIDRSFVADVEANANAAAIVEAVISLANSLKIGVVAEGIETQAQLGFLRERRCATGQGYLFAKPMPASRVPYFMRTWSRSDPTTRRRVVND